MSRVRPKSAVGRNAARMVLVIRPSHLAQPSGSDVTTRGEAEERRALWTPERPAHEMVLIQRMDRRSAPPRAGQPLKRPQRRTCYGEITQPKYGPKAARAIG